MTNTRLFLQLATLSLCLLAGGQTYAQGDRAKAAAAAEAAKINADSSDPDKIVTFEQLDINHNGVLSRAELKPNDWLYQNFDQVDTNHDGVLSRAEFEAWRKARIAELRASKK
jgi:hypothetical protein